MSGARSRRRCIIDEGKHLSQRNMERRIGMLENRELVESIDNPPWQFLKIWSSIFHRILKEHEELDFKIQSRLSLTQILTQHIPKSLLEKRCDLRKDFIVVNVQSLTFIPEDEMLCIRANLTPLSDTVGLPLPHKQWLIVVRGGLIPVMEKMVKVKDLLAIWGGTKHKRRTGMMSLTLNAEYGPEATILQFQEGEQRVPLNRLGTPISPLESDDVNMCFCKADADSETAVTSSYGFLVVPKRSLRPAVPVVPNLPGGFFPASQSSSSSNHSRPFSDSVGCSNKQRDSNTMERDSNSRRMSQESSGSGISSPNVPYPDEEEEMETSVVSDSDIEKEVIEVFECLKKNLSGKDSNNPTNPRDEKLPTGSTKTGRPSLSKRKRRVEPSTSDEEDQAMQDNDIGQSHPPRVPPEASISNHLISQVLDLEMDENQPAAILNQHLISQVSNLEVDENQPSRIPISNQHLISQVLNLEVDESQPSRIPTSNQHLKSQVLNLKGDESQPSRVPTQVSNQHLISQVLNLEGDESQPSRVPTPISNQHLISQVLNLEVDESQLSRVPPKGPISNHHRLSQVLDLEVNESHPVVASAVISPHHNFVPTFRSPRTHNIEKVLEDEAHWIFENELAGHHALLTSRPIPKFVGGNFRNGQDQQLPDVTMDAQEQVQEYLQSQVLNVSGRSQNLKDQDRRLSESNPILDGTFLISDHEQIQRSRSRSRQDSEVSLSLSELISQELGNAIDIPAPYIKLESSTELIMTKTLSEIVNTNDEFNLRCTILNSFFATNRDGIPTEDNVGYLTVEDGTIPNIQFVYPNSSIHIESDSSCVIKVHNFNCINQIAEPGTAVLLASVKVEKTKDGIFELVMDGSSPGTMRCIPEEDYDDDDDDNDSNCTQPIIRRPQLQLELVRSRDNQTPPTVVPSPASSSSSSSRRCNINNEISNGLAIQKDLQPTKVVTSNSQSQKPIACRLRSKKISVQPEKSETRGQTDEEKDKELKNQCRSVKVKILLDRLNLKDL